MIFTEFIKLQNPRANFQSVSAKLLKIIIDLYYRLSNSEHDIVPHVISVINLNCEGS